MNKTLVKSTNNESYKWYIIDAENKHLGRLSTAISTVLLGKNSPDFHPSQKAKHAVIVINAEKVKFTGNKLLNKKYYRVSGYMGGLKTTSAQEMLKNAPERVIMEAVKGMLPKNSLGRKQLTKLKVYAGENHDHEAQKPQKMEV